MKKLSVDENTCIGCGLCVNTYPEYFEYTSEGTSKAKKTLVEDGDTNAEEAAQSCPTAAITLEETKEENPEK